MSSSGLAKKNTTGRGELTEFELITLMMRQGRMVLRPLSTGLRYDFLLDNGDGTFDRVQCKTGILRDGVIEFRVANTDVRRPNGVSYRGQIETFAVYCPQNRRGYLVPLSAVEDTNGIARLRLSPSKNGQTKRIRYAEPFEIRDVDALAEAHPSRNEAVLGPRVELGTCCSSDSRSTS